MKPLLLLLILTLNLSAATTYYVDSDYTGTQSGTASQPFRTLTAQWSTINTALASGDVLIYFSARQAASDTEQVYSSTGSLPPDKIFTYNRTDSSGHVLTFNGRSFYNTSDSSPSWSAYSGTNKCRVMGFISQNDTNKHSNITIDGFHITNQGDEKGVSIAGDNAVVANNLMEGTSGGGNPILLLVPTANGAHEGSSAFASACTNIVITNNIAFNSSGETFYIGGGGSNAGGAGSGYPSHDQVVIIDNTIFNSGYWDNQGDGIDVKGGITNLRIEHNTIFNVGLNGGSFRTNTIGDASRAIVTQGLFGISSDSRQIVRNIIYASTNIEDGAIALADSWGVQKGTLIANNLIYGISHTGHFPDGIKVYSTSGAITNANNTIYGCTGYAIETSPSSTVTAENNLLINNNAGGAQVSYGGTVTLSDYNGYAGSIGYGGEGAHSFATTAIANFTTPGSVFTLISGATAIGKAATLTMFTTDLTGAARSAPWDAGAYSFSGAPAPTLVSVAITPATASIPVSATQQFTATGTYSDSSTADITSSCVWTSGSATIASINGSGLGTGLLAGTATITATKSAIAGSATLTVTASAAVSGKTKLRGRVHLH